MISPDRKHSSNTAMVSAIAGSGYASRSGIPRPSRGSSVRSSSLAYSSTRLGPRTSPIAAPTARPLALSSREEAWDECVTRCLSGRRGDLRNMDANRGYAQWV